ncbi:MAG: hypothetical protein EOP86_16160, partial [Verrucomicrobiaceae bacterium]
MSKAKQNTFLTGYFAALAVGAIGVGYLAWSASSGATEAAEKYEATKTQLDKLQKAKIFPKQENVEAKKKQVAGFTEQVAALNDNLRKYQPALETMDASAFQAKLQRLRDGLQTEAKNANVKLPDNFDLGMGTYLSAFPETEAVPRLNAWLEGLNFVVSTLISKQHLQSSKADMVSGFTGGRSASSKDLTTDEATAMIRHLKSLDPEEQKAEVGKKEEHDEVG